MAVDPIPLGIVAGGGALPARIAAAARLKGRAPFIVALEGHADLDALRGLPHATVRLGAAGAAIDALRGAGVIELLFAGGVRRPSLLELRPDWRAAAFFAKVGWRALGDDGLLSAIIKELEGEGFKVVKAAAFLDDLVPGAGLLAGAAPDDRAEADIAHGRAVLAALGPLEVGQAVVVQQGLVLGIEAIEGTDALLARAAELRRQGPGGVLVKWPKPGQSDRADLPTIGPDTVAGAARAGLRGIAIAAGGSWIVDREATIAAAEAEGLFLVSR